MGEREVWGQITSPIAGEPVGVAAQAVIPQDDICLLLAQKSL